MSRRPFFAAALALLAGLVAVSASAQDWPQPGKTIQLIVPAPGTTSTISIVVTAQDGTTTQSYTLALSQTSGADATLSALAISAGSLTPSFAGGTLAYSATVPHGTASVTVTPPSGDVRTRSPRSRRVRAVAAYPIDDHPVDGRQPLGQKRLGIVVQLRQRERRGGEGVIEDRLR